MKLENVSNQLEMNITVKILAKPTETKNKALRC